MKSSPAHLFTAMPSLFYHDVRGAFATAAKWRQNASPNGLLIGDAHLGNLFTFVGPDDNIVWGWGDCDKAVNGALEWDVDRLAASIVIVARLSKENFSEDDQASFVAAAADAYLKVMREFVGSGARPKAYLTDLHGVLATLADRAGAKSQKHYVRRHAPEGEIAKAKKLSAPEERALSIAVNDYAARLGKNAGLARPIHILDMGYEDADNGGSNAGFVKYLVLLQSTDKVPVLLKIKRLVSSGIARVNAEETVKDINTLEGFHDPLLGYATLDGHGYLFQPMTAGRAQLDPLQLGKNDFLTLCAGAGEALARAELQDQNVARGEIENWLGDRAGDAEAMHRLERFAADYATQIARDQEALKKKEKAYD